MSKKESKRILIVDDEPSVPFALSMALETDGVEVVTASRIETAEKALMQGRIDLVISDIRFGGVLEVEGLELLSYIKRQWPKTPVIMMTAYGTKAIRDDAVRRGADRYYEKPFDIGILTACIKSIVSENKE